MIDYFIQHSAEEGKNADPCSDPPMPCAGFTKFAGFALICVSTSTYDKSLWILSVAAGLSSKLKRINVILLNLARRLASPLIHTALGLIEAVLRSV